MCITYTQVHPLSVGIFQTLRIAARGYFAAAVTAAAAAGAAGAAAVVFVLIVVAVVAAVVEVTVDPATAAGALATAAA
jgi:hypothetical protein